MLNRLSVVTIYVLLHYVDGEDINVRYASEVAMGDPADLISTNPHHRQPKLYKDLGRRFVPQYSYVETLGAKNTESNDDDDITLVLTTPEMILDVAKQSSLLDKSYQQTLSEDMIKKIILRSELQGAKNSVSNDDDDMPRVLANLMVLDVAKQSSLLAKSYPQTLSDDMIKKIILRSETQGAMNTESNEGDDITPVLATPEMVLDVAKQSSLLAKSYPQTLSDDMIQKNILRSGEYWNGFWKENANPENLLRSSVRSQSLNTIRAKLTPGSDLYEIVSRLRELSSSEPKLLYIINKDNYEHYLLFNIVYPMKWILELDGIIIQ